MGGGTTINNSETKIEALKLQSSAYGVTVPVVGGVNRIAGNLVYYADFTAIPHTSSQGSGGKGGGVKTTNTAYTYTASVVMGLCHGPVQGIRSIWVGKKRYDSAWIQPAMKTYKEDVTVVNGGSYTVAHTTNFNLLRIMLLEQSEFNPLDYFESAPLTDGFHYRVDAATGKIVWLSNTIESVEGYWFFNRSQPVNEYAGRTVRVVYTSMDNGYSQSAAQQLGVSFMQGYDYPAQQAPSFIQSLHPGDAISYPHQALVYAQNYQLGSGAQVENHTFEVIGFGAYSISPSIPDCNPADFLRTVLLNARWGARMPADMLHPMTEWSDYCLSYGLLMSPALTEQMTAAELVQRFANLTNAAACWSVNKLKIIPYGDKAATGNGATYTPNLTPIYDLTDDHFVFEEGEAPVIMNRSGAADRYNNVKLQFSNRANYYNNEVVEVKDDADIQDNSLRTMDDVAGGDWICEPTIAKTVAQLLMQRSLNVTAEFEFRLPWTFCLLEPMDLVTITDADLGLDKFAVRIRDIQENDLGDLSIKAESFVQGVAEAAMYDVQPNIGYRHDYNKTPSAVAAVAIFEAPTELTDNGLGVFVAAAGGNSAWGGCNVWVSLDGGVNYKRIGTIYGGARIGRLQTDLAAGDTAMTIALDGNGGDMISASSSVAGNNQSLLWVEGPQGGEYMNYTNAALVASNVYSLTGLQRGAYLNPSNLHGSNSRIVRIDDAVVASGHLDLSFIGQELFFKFTSFNVYGAGEEAVDTVEAYSYTVTGGQIKLPPPTPSGLQIAGDKILWNTVADGDVAGYRLRAQFGINRDWGTAAPLHEGLTTLNTFTLRHKLSGVTTVLLKAVDTLGNESDAPAVAIANLGDLPIDNVFELWAEAEAWTGIKTNCARTNTTVDGVLAWHLLADTVTRYWPGDTGSLYWSQSAATFWPTQMYADMTYEALPITPSVEGTMRLDLKAAGEGIAIDYKRGDQRSFWAGSGTNSFWGTSGNFWPAFTPVWTPFAGGVAAQPADPITFRISIKGGPVRGTVTTFTPKLDVPDVVQDGSATVGAGGGRIALTKTFRAIKSVTCTIAGDTTTAVRVKVVDRDPVSGPLIYCYDAAGAQVAGEFDYQIKGY